MITTPVIVNLRIPDGGAPRSEGIHVSSVLRCIAAETGYLKPEYVESLDLVDLSQASWWASLAPSVQLKISLGMAWDHYYLPSLGTVTPHPGELCLDGIYMTPDGESVDFIHTTQIINLAIHEVKFTYKSVKTVGNLVGQWLWLAQMKAYCKAAMTRFAYMHVCFACGDYKFPITPQVKVWLVEFTQLEIDDNWDIITGYVQHRKLAEQEDAGLEGGV